MPSGSLLASVLSATPWDSVYSAPDPISNLTSDKIVEPHVTPLLSEPFASDVGGEAGSAHLALPYESPDMPRLQKAHHGVPVAEKDDLEGHPTTLRTVQDRSMTIHTSPLLPAAFHQIYMDMTENSQGQERLQVRVCTLCESGHLHPTPLQLPRGMASPSHLPEAEPMLPSISRFSLHTHDTPEASYLPSSATVKSEGVRSLLSGTNPHRTRPMDSVLPLSYLHHRDSQPRPQSASQTPKSLQVYDMSTMLRSIEKWDPVVEWPDAMDGSEMTASPLHARPSEVGPLSGSRSSSRNLQTPTLHLRTELSTSAPSLMPLSLRSNSVSTPSSSSFPRSDTPSTFSNVSAFAQSLLGHFPSSASLVSSSSMVTNPSASQPQSLWQSICVRLLPLFYDQVGDLRIESISETMDTYVRSLFERDPEQAPALLEDHLQKLISTGLMGVTMQLQQSVGTQQARELVRVWLHYYDTVLPYIHASMLPLETKLQSWHLSSRILSRPGNRLRTLIAPEDEEDALPTSEQHASAKDETPGGAVPPVLDVRRVLLLAFRDQVVLPVSDWLYSLTTRVDAEPWDATTSLRSRLTQMVHILSCLYTQDGAQERIERLSRALADPLPCTSSRLSIQTSTPSFVGLSLQPSPVSPLPTHVCKNQLLDSPTLGIPM
ncbi:hypothetical protein MNAN1_001951 [Malassezia nana]|uniref:HbrB-like protein n=1 Tax=Malassezia nana TaxID=180528 RepID=A0AAF0J2F3_9BASI|nr:hypothetical protein MNAN1_001951 [Malassezia nana]